MKTLTVPVSVNTQGHYTRRQLSDKQECAVAGNLSLALDINGEHNVDTVHQDIPLREANSKKCRYSMKCNYKCNTAGIYMTELL